LTPFTTQIVNFAAKIGQKISQNLLGVYSIPTSPAPRTLPTTPSTDASALTHGAPAWRSATLAHLHVELAH